MGRASNRKKTQRQAGSSSRQAGPSSKTDAATQQAMRQFAVGLQALIQETEERRDRETAARRMWSGGAEPVSAEALQWPEGSLGGRFFGGFDIERARNAPSLTIGQIPDAAVIAADSAQWKVATSALVRAIVFDGLTQDHPAVSTLLEVLVPIAEAELAYGEAADAIYGAGLTWDEDEPEFPEEDGPVFLLGACVLMDAVWAAVGLDSLSDVLGVLQPVLDDAVPSLDGQVAADALIGAFTRHYQCKMPGDAELLQRIGHRSGNALENLVRAGAVPPRDILPTGLTLLSALGQLCQSDSPSLLQPVAAAPR